MAFMENQPIYLAISQVEKAGLPPLTGPKLTMELLEHQVTHLFQVTHLLMALNVVV